MLAELIGALVAVFGQRQFAVREVIDAAARNPALADVLRRHRLLNSVALGKTLTMVQGVRPAGVGGPAIWCIFTGPARNYYVIR